MFTHLLVPLDGSDFAELALQYALSLAEKYGAELTLLRVVNPPRWQSMMEAESPELFEKLRHSVELDARNYLDYQKTALEQAGYRVQMRIECCDKPPADAILDAVEAWDADAIVMSTHGRSGLQRWMFGSVAERVVRHAQVPVLLIRPGGKRPLAPTPSSS
ncbi:MAG: universal stress protein [Anaerolineales bacterium]|nr:universal stress protein [Anaerolineales bacterium]